MCEKVLDEENWKLEAQSVIDDIKKHVDQAEISTKIDGNNNRIYMNIRTIEGEDFCVELSALGFRLCGNGPDQINLNGKEYYETAYSLLNSISPKFCESFGNELVEKLNRLAKEQGQ